MAYTPTTDEVSAAWVKWARKFRPHRSWSKGAAEFDRWLARVRYEAALNMAVHLSVVFSDQEVAPYAAEWLKENYPEEPR